MKCIRHLNFSACRILTRCVKLSRGNMSHSANNLYWIYFQSSNRWCVDTLPGKTAFSPSIGFLHKTGFVRNMRENIRLEIKISCCCVYFDFFFCLDLLRKICLATPSRYETHFRDVPPQNVTCRSAVAYDR